MAIENIKIVVGLGNPDEEYAHTYHNAGALAVTALAPNAAWRRTQNFRYTKEDGIVFVVPELFMNESGEAVKAALRYFKLKPEEMLLIHDESDLPIGEFKVQFGRGSAGHKGVASVIAAIKTDQFFRARIGIRPPDERRRRKAETFVLNHIGKNEREKLERVFAQIAAELKPRSD